MSAAHSFPAPLDNEGPITPDHLADLEADLAESAADYDDGWDDFGLFEHDNANAELAHDADVEAYLRDEPLTETEQAGLRCGFEDGPAAVVGVRA